MAGYVKVLAAKLEDLSLIPKSHLVEGESDLSGCPLTSVCSLTLIFFEIEKFQENH